MRLNYSKILKKKQYKNSSLLLYLQPHLRGLPLTPLQFQRNTNNINRFKIFVRVPELAKKKNKSMR